MLPQDSLRGRFKDEHPEATQTPGAGGKEPAEGRGLGHRISGVSAHGALPTTVHGGVLGKTQKVPDGDGARLALHLPPSGGPDANASVQDLTSYVGWA